MWTEIVYKREGESEKNKKGWKKEREKNGGGII